MDRTQSHCNMPMDDSYHEWQSKHKRAEISKDFHNAQKLGRVVIRPGKQYNHRNAQHPVDEAYSYKIGVG